MLPRGHGSWRPATSEGCQQEQTLVIYCPVQGQHLTPSSSPLGTGLSQVRSALLSCSPSTVISLKCKGKGPLTVKSSHRRLGGCDAHLALQAEGASVCPQTVFLARGQHDGATEHQNQNSAWKCHLPSRRSGTYLSTYTFWHAFELLGPSNGSSPHHGNSNHDLLIGKPKRLSGLDHSVTCIPCDIA
ncbi:Hypothetical predicted protein [Podarcis lilfordi]|uniref:Uncharacterized protein n=1 Tax=Podarcis lilfordi TaxID=74358 RepID=A0AA35LLG9_9SAUR|nr:Hypothetical predicted protein [Podarcis lilfordi]